MTARDSGGSGRAKSDSRAPASFGAFVPKRAERAAPDNEAEAALRAESTDSWPEDAVEVGAIVDAYGLKGWVKVSAHASAGQGGDALLSAKRWWLEKGRERKSARMAQAKVHGEHIVAQLGGLADRDDALGLRGYRVHVSRADFPALGEDEFYWVDLVDLEVVNEAGVALGRVADLIDNGAHTVLRVEYPSIGKDGEPATGERLIPFVGVYVKAVDQAAKRIIVDWEADY
ncbi:16S rRNA processing protein RimM [Trinickia symbiotica]|uniref:Ribosome maturation factor RimM n=1 Tax=Trinickia symbiotica TaxID=863227 RepID=A0A2N7X1R8_9BURK|nr:ribosome maturation factor RimM [Trinickia symbiotica]PMS35699.1 ribosome maturation factor RimM [Trinickia symbiotica]PPK47777.1 16S rRNA processing protein RimM [Trinickia symbiotica]